MAKPKKPPIDYVAKVSSLDWASLETLWKNIEKRKTTGWASGKAFEHLVLRAFSLSGLEVIWPYSTYLNGQIIEQIDGMVVFDGISVLVETKDYDAGLNVEPLAKLRNQLLRRPAGVIGCVFSSSGFTDPAKTLAHYMAPNSIMLWQGPEVIHCVRNRDFMSAIRKKYRGLIQHGIPDFDVRA